MRRRLVPAAAAAGLLACLGLPGGALAAGGAGAPNLQCNGAYTGTYGNVNVPPGDTCDLTDSTVLGDATIQNAATLNLDQSARATVRGAIFSAANSNLNQSDGWTVDGTITADAAGFLDIGGGTTHNVVSDRSDDVYVYSATVEGSIVADRTQSYGEVAANNLITGSIVANGEPSASGGFYIEGQPIGGSVYITGNQAPTQVLFNAIGQNLVCEGNNPPPSDDGYGNQVNGREIGQCAGLTNSPDDGPSGG